MIKGMLMLFSVIPAGVNHRLEPVTAQGILSIVLNIMCASLNVIRGVHLVENTFQVCLVWSKICPLKLSLCFKIVWSYVSERLFNHHLKIIIRLIGSKVHFQLAKMVMFV